MKNNNLQAADVNIMNADTDWKGSYGSSFMLIPDLIYSIFLKPIRYWENIFVLVTEIIRYQLAASERGD